MQRKYQRDRGFPDIAWNFIINAYGEVFEGVGWGFEGYHTAGQNYDSLGVAFVGDFNVFKPSDAALDAFRSLMRCGVERGDLRRNYGIWGHSDFSRKTDCPGEFLYHDLTHMLYFNTNNLTSRLEDSPQNATLFNDAKHQKKIMQLTFSQNHSQMTLHDDTKKNIEF